MFLVKVLDKIVMKTNVLWRKGDWPLWVFEKLFDVNFKQQNVIIIISLVSLSSISYYMVFSGKNINFVLHFKDVSS